MVPTHHSSGFFVMKLLLSLIAETGKCKGTLTMSIHILTNISLPFLSAILFNLLTHG